MDTHLKAKFTSLDNALHSLLTVQRRHEDELRKLDETRSRVQTLVVGYDRLDSFVQTLAAQAPGTPSHAASKNKGNITHRGAKTQDAYKESNSSNNASNANIQEMEET